MDRLEPVKMENEKLVILDQTLLPGEEKYIALSGVGEICDAIKRLKVRGAPAIGVAAAIGIYASMRESHARDLTAFRSEYMEAHEKIRSARPTAVNLMHAMDRMLGVLERSAAENEGRDGAVENILSALRDEAVNIREEDIAACRAMGEHGLKALGGSRTLLTHCNAGALATAGYGTALSPVYVGQERGIDFRVYADETRPLLQGARLTAWELARAGIDVTLICDNMAGALLKSGAVDAVVVGCDRMAANGDGANKIGTMPLAAAAHQFGVPFYMFVPTTTIDLDTKTGADIVIEQRSGDEITGMWYEKPMAPDGVKTYNPAFDVTPAEFITAVVTERGTAYPPYEKSLKEIAGAR
ncbi:MAG: S-methyl-5-thioribose-1-phosphate isomerase [Anaerovoracaceae bacterium]|nr:S-methyl-5-thioribose-1-phosphate isomerase [Anaerovoracaceae bacterium]